MKSFSQNKLKKGSEMDLSTTFALQCKFHVTYLTTEMVPIGVKKTKEKEEKQSIIWIDTSLHYDWALFISFTVFYLYLSKD